MKAINKLSILICLACLALLSACKKDLNQSKGITYGGPPPKPGRSIGEVRMFTC